ncbi:hypothetical protein C8Q80DRAFT_1118599 [Daedaleopsis nitida]|nr:hypothetical protein C8Q80DRAFT_1118599 [Daedaleopsis nitida]
MALKTVLVGRGSECDPDPSKSNVPCRIRGGRLWSFVLVDAVPGSGVGPSRFGGGVDAGLDVAEPPFLRRGMGREIVDWEGLSVGGGVLAGGPGAAEDGVFVALGLIMDSAGRLASGEPSILTQSSQAGSNPPPDASTLVMILPILTLSKHHPITSGSPEGMWDFHDDGGWWRRDEARAQHFNFVQSTQVVAVHTATPLQHAREQPARSQPDSSSTLSMHESPVNPSQCAKEESRSHSALNGSSNLHSVSGARSPSAGAPTRRLGEDAARPRQRWEPFAELGFAGLLPVRLSVEGVNYGRIQLIALFHPKESGGADVALVRECSSQ